MGNNKLHIDFDLSEFKKIEDIIFLDEPILTHYVKNDKSFLLYLVDTLDESDILLLLEVEEDTIFKYITGKISLLNVIIKNKNFCYIIEQDFAGMISNLNVTEGYKIAKSYLPSEDSFLIYQPSEQSHYYYLIKEYERKSYLQSLRQKAFYLKFKPLDVKYADTIGLNQLANILFSNLSLSFKSFLKADFSEVFKKIITDSKKQEKILATLLPDLDLRMVDLNYGSFEIGLAVDTVMKSSIENKEIKKWAIEVGDKFKEVVLNDTFEDKRLNKIVERYSEDDRNKIFNPLFKITQSSDFNLMIKKNPVSNYSVIRVKDKSKIEKLLPNPIVISKLPEEKDYEIVNFTTVLDKNKVKKVIYIDNTLFSSTNQTEVKIENSNFNEYGFELKDNISLPVQIMTNKDLIVLTANFDNIEFESRINTGNLSDGIRELTHKIYEYIVNKEK